jgi:nucleoside-diphosphate-sugar epimerase
MKMAIVGPTGVLGRALVPLLLKRGHSVRALALSPARTRDLFPEVQEAMQCDLLHVTDAALGQMLEGCEAAVHIATAIPRDPTAPHAWDLTTRLRTEGTRKLLDASLQAGVRRYLQQSITMAYADHGGDWIDEETPLDTSPQRAEICQPVIVMEQMVRETLPDRLAWCILRAGMFVGRDTFQENTITRLHSGEEIVPCDGSNFVSLVNVADMANAIALALEQAPAGSTYNVVNEPRRNGDYLDRLAEAVGAPRPQRDPSLPCPPSWRCSNEAIRNALGWRPAQGVIP